MGRCHRRGLDWCQAAPLQIGGRSLYEHILDNPDRRVVDYLRGPLHDADLFRVVSAFFTIYGFELLEDVLGGVDKTRFLFGDPTSVDELNPVGKDTRSFRVTEKGRGDFTIQAGGTSHLGGVAENRTASPRFANNVGFAAVLQGLPGSLPQGIKKEMTVCPRSANGQASMPWLEAVNGLAFSVIALRLVE